MSLISELLLCRNVYSLCRHIYRYKINTVNDNFKYIEPNIVATCIVIKYVFDWLMF
jgi:hypothetical protein